MSDANDNPSLPIEEVHAMVASEVERLRAMLEDERAARVDDWRELAEEHAAALAAKDAEIARMRALELEKTAGQLADDLEAASVAIVLAYHEGWKDKEAEVMKAVDGGWDHARARRDSHHSRDAAMKAKEEINGR